MKGSQLFSSACLLETLIQLFWTLVKAARTTSRTPDSRHGQFLSPLPDCFFKRRRCATVPCPPLLFSPPSFLFFLSRLFLLLVSFRRLREIVGRCFTLFSSSVWFAHSLSLSLYTNTLRYSFSRVCHLPFPPCFHSSFTPPFKQKQRQIDRRKMKCRWQTIVGYHLRQLPLVMFLLHIVYTLALAISLVLAILVLALVWLFHFCGMSYG